MKADSRNVKYFDCKLGAQATHKGKDVIDVPARTMLEVLKHIDTYLKINTFNRRNRAKTETWHVADIEIDEIKERAVLLISKSDRLAADQAISDPAIDQFQVTPKGKTQGNASSAHVVMNLKPVKKDIYLTIIEDSNGISSKDICTVLSMVLRASARQNKQFFYCNDPSGGGDETGKLLKYFSRYKFDMRGHPSEDFQTELNDGKLTGIEIVDITANAAIWDDQQVTIEKKKIIYLAVQNKSKLLQAYDAILSVCKNAKEKKLDSVRVLFKDKAKFSRTVELDTTTLQILNEDRFVKKERLINFTTRLDTGFEKIHPEIREKMLFLL